MAAVAEPAAPGDTIEQVRRATSKLDELLVAHESEAATVVAWETLAQQFRPELANSMLEAMPALVDTVRPTSAPATKKEPVDAGVAAGLAAAVRAASEVSNADDITRIAELARAVEDSTGGVAKQRLTELVAAVNDAVRRGSARVIISRRAQDAVAGLPDDPEADELRARAASVADEQQLAALTRAADDLRARYEQAEDDAFVADATMQVLRDLGYTVTQLESATQAEAAGQAHPAAARITPAGQLLGATRSDLPNHLLQVRLLPGSDTLVANVVGLADTTPAQDQAAEDRTCGDVLALPRMLDRHGVRLEPRFAHPVGAVPVKRSQDVPRATAQPARKQRQTTKTREAGA